MEILERFKVVPVGIEGKSRGSCEGCGYMIWSDGAYSIPKLAGLYCKLECIEARLFGTERCRWCGDKMEKSYTTVDSRLCSENCSANYYAHVLGDKTAALGTGKRFMLWLQKHSRETYRQMVGTLPVTPKLVTGRRTKNHHAMSAAERAREYRNRRTQNVTKSKGSLLASERARVTLQTIENTI